MGFFASRSAPAVEAALPAIEAGASAVGEGAGKIGSMISKYVPAAMQWGNGALGAIPIVRDLLKGGADPEKIAQVKKMRDDRIEQIVGSMPGIDRNKATAQANDEFHTMISQAENEGTTSPGEIAGDAAGLAGDLLMGKYMRRGMEGGKKTNANAPTPGGPKTASEGVNGVDTAAKPMQNTMAKAPDEPEMVHNAVEERAEMPSTGFTMNSPRLTMNGATGGMSPVDREELMRAAMKAKMMDRARQNPGMSNVAIPMGGAPSPMMALGDSMHGQTLNRQDAERMRQMMYGANGA